VPDFLDRADHRVIDPVLRQVAHEHAVDLQQVGPERLDVGERRDAAAKIVERKRAADAAQRADQLVGLAEVADRDLLRGLETEVPRIDAARGEALADELAGLRIDDAVARQVDVQAPDPVEYC